MIAGGGVGGWLGWLGCGGEVCVCVGVGGGWVGGGWGVAPTRLPGHMHLWHPQVTRARGYQPEAAATHATPCKWQLPYHVIACSTKAGWLVPCAGKCGVCTLGVLQGSTSQQPCLVQGGVQGSRVSAIRGGAGLGVTHALAWWILGTAWKSMRLGPPNTRASPAGAEGRRAGGGAMAEGGGPHAMRA